MTILLSDLQVWPWPSTYLNKCFCAKLFWNPCINVQVMAPISSIYDHFIIWPSSMTLIFKCLNKCFKWHFYASKRITVPYYFEIHANVKVMARISSIYDHFIIWPSSVTLTFNIPDQIFQMALLLVKENKCAKLFWNPCINVHLMAQKSSRYDHFIIWPSKVTLTFNLPEQWFQLAFPLLRKNTCAQLFWNPCINVGVSLNLWPFLSSDSQVWPWPSAYLSNCFKWHFSSLRTTTVPNYFEIHA